MSTKREHPLSIRDVSPGDGAVKLADSVHTGGTWLYQNRVWKPLDGRPYQNAPVHIETDEERCLTALARQPLFPKNWEVKESNGRRWLIRDKVQFAPKGALYLSERDALYIEEGISNMNSLGWEVNDNIVIGRDRQGQLFVLDLSAAQKMGKRGAYSSSVGKLARESS